MKTAIYIEDGVTQLVLTPQTEWEQKVVDMITDGNRNISIIKGSFYEGRKNDCDYFKRSEYVDDESLIIKTSIKSDKL